MPASAWMYASSEASQVLRDLKGDEQHGLASDEARERLALRGRNELKIDKQKPTFMARVLEKLGDPMILMLLGSAVVSVFVQNYDDAVSITLAIAIVLVVALVQEARSEKSLEALNRLVPYTCKCLRDGVVSTLNVEELVPGDIVVLSVGDRVPADLRLLQAVDFALDESMLTGESASAEKQVGTVPEGRSEIAQQTNIAFMGTLVVHGHGRGIVIGTGKYTEFGQIFLSLGDIEEKKTVLQVQMDQLGKLLSAISFTVIAVIFALGIQQGNSWLHMLTIVVSLAVAAVPEGLPIVVTVTLALGVMRMAERKAIVKKLPAVETLGAVNVICVDKTGTLTKNEMEVAKVFTLSRGQSVAASELDPHDADLSPTFSICSICNDSMKNEAGERVGQPTEVAMLELLDALGVKDIRGSSTRIQEIPFSSEQKWMVVQATTDKEPAQPLFYVKGASEVVLEKCVTYFQSPKYTPLLTQKHREAILASVAEMSREGLRVLGLAYGADLNQLTFSGLVGLIDPLREGVKESAARLAEGSVSVVMITGDSFETACAIGRQLNLLTDGDIEAEVMSGDSFDLLDEETQREVVGPIKIFYRATPQHKLSIIKAHQARGSVVAMTGDGVNDAPALKMADIGVAMGKQGTDVSREASDMVLVDDNFSTILAAIEEGKSIYHNIKNFVTFQLSTSIAALALIATCTLLRLPNPLNAMQILWINIIMDGPPAQSLGVEPVDADVMKRPPRDQRKPIINATLLARTIISASSMFLVTFWIYVLESMESQPHEAGMTATFTAFVFADMFNALGCRSSTKSIFQTGLFSNRALSISIATTFLLQLAVVTFPAFHPLLQTTSLGVGDLLFIFVSSSSVLWIEEGRKALMRERIESLSHAPSKSLSATMQPVGHQL